LFVVVSSAPPPEGSAPSLIVEASYFCLFFFTVFYALKIFDCLIIVLSKLCFEFFHFKQIETTQL